MPEFKRKSDLLKSHFYIQSSQKAFPPTRPGQAKPGQALSLLFIYFFLIKSKLGIVLWAE